jgi:hypothetical protein
MFSGERGAELQTACAGRKGNTWTWMDSRSPVCEGQEDVMRSKSKSEGSCRSTHSNGKGGTIFPGGSKWPADWLLMQMQTYQQRAPKMGSINQ